MVAKKKPSEVTPAVEPECPHCGTLIVTTFEQYGNEYECCGSAELDMMRENAEALGQSFDRNKKKLLRVLKKSGIDHTFLPAWEVKINRMRGKS